MVPDTDLQLKVVLKALREVVLPAVDPANGVALEQLHLAMMTVDLVRGQMPFRHQRIRQELRNARDLAAQVADAGGSGIAVDLIAEAEAALGDPEGSEAALDAIRLRILSAVEEVVATSGGKAEIARAVIAATRPQTLLTRAWCAPAGFEVDPQHVPPLDSLLTR